MATLTVTFDDAFRPLIAQAFAESYGYEATLAGKPNPQTPDQFAQQCVVNFIRETVKGYQVRGATEKARQAAVEAAKAVDTVPITIAG